MNKQNLEPVQNLSLRFLDLQLIPCISLPFSIGASEAATPGLLPHFSATHGSSCSTYHGLCDFSIHLIGCSNDLTGFFFYLSKSSLVRSSVSAKLLSVFLPYNTVFPSNLD